MPGRDSRFEGDQDPENTLKPNSQRAYGGKPWVHSWLHLEACPLYCKVVLTWFPPDHQTGRNCVEL